MANYIDKAALVAEIERRVNLNDTCQKISGGNEFYRGAIDEAKEILSFIDTLEVKEVDLGKEIDDYMAKEWEGIEEDKPFYDMIKNELSDIAKHFYSLGLKAQKGE